MSVNKKIIETEAQVALQDAFNIVTYSGNSSTQSVTGVGFQPDLIWIKSRNISGANHNLYDSTRGAGKLIFPNLNINELTTSDMTGFSSDGFNFTGSAYDSNNSGNNLVAWCWRANGGTTTSGSGTGGTTNVTHQLNSGAGFCITKFTSNNNGGTSGGSTVNHGLDSAPDLIMLKSLDTIAQNWSIWVTGFSGSEFLYLNTTGAKQTSVNMFNGVAPDSSKVTLGAWNNQGAAFILYAFKNVEGFSKIGSYTGTSSSGNSVNVGFAPDWVLIKGVSAGSSWILHDTVRSDGTAHLRPNTSGAEDTGSNEQINFTSTGFSIRNSGATQINTSGDTYIYMAFKIT